MRELTRKIRDQINESYPFEVNKFPLSGPDNMPTPHYGLFRSDNGESVGVACRQGYVPHTRDDVQALAEAATIGMDADDMVVSCHWHDGHRITIGPSADKRQEIYGTKDNIFPRFLIDFGYGGSACKASLGLYRDVCKNLQIIEVAGESFIRKIRHTAGLRHKMPELIGHFRHLAGRWDRLAETVHAMQGRDVVLAEYLAKVYPASEDANRRAKKANERRISAIVRRIQNERALTGRPLTTLTTVSAWEAYNGVQGYVQHETVRHGRPSRLDRAWRALGDTHVTRAADVAMAS